MAVPLRINDEAVRLAVISKLGWIKRKQTEFAEQPRQSQREMISGESHYYLGQRYRLNVFEKAGANRVDVKAKTIHLYIRPGTDQQRREAILTQWYRQQIKKLIPELLTKWEPIIGVQVSEWGVKKMKTRWGTCNIAAKRIWLNLELAKKPIQCIEYILVHELVHLLERRHNDGFRELMDQVMPQWRMLRETLNKAPLGHEDWSY